MRTERFCRVLAVLALAIAIASSRSAAAQSSSEVNAGLQFNFGSPGSRSLGLGGAFVGLADDATAVFVNPAGLTQLLKTEVAFELRGVSYTTFFTNGGRGFGVPAELTPVSGLTEGQTTRRVGELNFVSAVIPVWQWSFALYRHELARFRAAMENEGPLKMDTVTILGQTQIVFRRMLPSRSHIDLKVVSYGASAARLLGEKVSIGVTVARQDFSLESQTTRYGLPEGTLGPADFSPQFESQYQVQRGRDSKIVFHSGVLWRVNDHLGIGASYQQGSNFRIGVRAYQAPSPPPEPVPGKFHVPAVYRLGAVYSFGPTAKIAVEVDRIRYSRLTRDLVPLYGENAALYRADDGTEIHLGLQGLLGSDVILDRIHYPLVVSVGTWRDPDHRVRYTRDPTIPGSLSDPIDPVLLFRRGPPTYHFSVGAAVAMGDSHEVGIAYDYSRRQRTAALSAVVRY